MPRIGHRNAATILALCWTTCLPGWACANGDAFFRFNLFEMSDTPIEEQTIYMGNVKDVDGNYIMDATITVGITVPTSRGERRVTYNAYTDVVGRYRTLDVASVILALEEIEYEVDPQDVQVTVEKDGYEVVRRLDRSRRSQKSGVFEINFLMAETGKIDPQSPP